MKPEVLLMSSRFDLATDYVAAGLRDRGIPFFRLNSEDLTSFEIEWDPISPSLRIFDRGSFEVLAGEGLNAVYYRRPTFYRHTQMPSKEALVAHHWLTFLRGLQTFSSCEWMNRPSADFRAENKMVQLHTASRLGLKTPRTLISNCTRSISTSTWPQRIAVKGLDTVLWKDSEFQYFGYTNIEDRDALVEEDFSCLPTIIQPALQPKLDVRVTVAGGKLWAVAVTRAGESIDGDWRLLKDDVEYELHALPRETDRSCRALVRELGLQFGAIDLVRYRDEYLFIEINPLGEWVWLDERLRLGISDTIVEWLAASAET